MIKTSDKDKFVRKGIIQFDLPGLPNGAQVSLTLRLVLEDIHGGDARRITVSVVTEDIDWNENSVTWNSIGSPAIVVLGGFPISRDDEGKAVDFELGRIEPKNGKLTLLLENLRPAHGHNQILIKTRETDSPPLLKGKFN